MDPWSQATIDALEKVKPLVVHVSALDRKESSLTLGTGVVLDRHHVLTSGQIATPGEEITLRTHDGRKFSATCLGVDPLYFVAVLHVSGELPVELPAHTPEAELRAGRWVLAVGFALGLEHTASHGIINASDYTVYRPERLPVDGLIITDATIHPGNAGGALVDLDGRLAGLNGIPWVQGLSLALSFPMAARLASQMIDYGRATHPWLGFSGQPEIVDPTMVQILGLPVDRGVVIQYVNPDGPGARAGVEEMDMVVRIGDRPARHVGQIRRTMALQRPGDRVPMLVLRGSELLNLDIPVEEIPQLANAD